MQYLSICQLAPKEYSLRCVKKNRTKLGAVEDYTFLQIKKVGLTSRDRTVQMVGACSNRVIESMLFHITDHSTIQEDIVYW